VHESVRAGPPAMNSYLQVTAVIAVFASDPLLTVVCLGFLRTKASTLVLYSARLSHRNSVRPSVCHTSGSVKNGAS